MRITASVCAYHTFRSTVAAELLALAAMDLHPPSRGPLSVQAFGVRTDNQTKVPDCALALAILVRGVEDLRTYRFARRRRDQRLYLEARAWIENDDVDWPYSFVNLCEQFGFDPGAMREALLGNAALGDANGHAAGADLAAEM